MEKIKFEIDLIERRFQNLNINRKNIVNKLTQNFTKVESTIKSIESEKIQERLNDIRQQLISTVEQTRHENLSLLDSNHLIEFKTNETIPNILGKIRIENEFSLVKKIYYINLYDFLNEVKLMNETKSDYRLIDVIFISSNVSNIPIFLVFEYNTIDTELRNLILRSCFITLSHRITTTIN